MKKYGYIILLSFIGVLVLLVFIFSKEKEKIPPFKERIGSISLSAEWLNTKQSMDGLIAAIKKNPEDYKSMFELAQAYIQEARITGDHGYYDKAALELLDQILKKQPENFDALCCKAVVLLSQHHFTDGLEIAKKAQPLNPYSAFIYGLLCDANVELGKYDEAVKMADKMVSIRPDNRSYSRVSYLREIYGDMPGAIQAMKMAVAAGYPGLEQTEWTRVVLAHLYENKGKLDSAEMQYQLALAERPDYAFAVAGLGKIAKVKKDYPTAIQYFEKAQKTITEFSFTDELTDLYKLNNQPDKAKESANTVIEMLSPMASDNEGQSGHGHYADKELAYAYLKVPDLENALKHAMIEYARRPDNIDVCETVAWVHYKRGEFAEAKKYIETALRTGSHNPILLCRAGLIKIKAGEKEKGKQLIEQAFALNPHIDIDLKTEAENNIKF